MVKLRWTSASHAPQKTHRVRWLAASVVGSALLVLSICGKENVEDRLGHTPDTVIVNKARILPIRKRSRPSKRPPESHAFREVQERYTPRSLNCARTPGESSIAVFEYAGYFYHNSIAIRNPAGGRPEPSEGGEYRPPYELLDGIENMETEEIFRLLQHLDALEITEHRGFRSVPRAHIMLEELEVGGSSYSEDCLQINGEVYLIAARAIEVLKDRLMNEELEMEEVLAGIPTGLRTIFYDRLSHALFTDELTFDPDFNNQILLGFTDEEKQVYFNHLFRCVLMNDLCLEMAQETLDNAEDEIVRWGLNTIIEEARRRQLRIRYAIEAAEISNELESG